jgi:NAD(P)-dependent dehydrogenase (short-subunit alcohol dehydrogenase family)
MGLKVAIADLDQTSLDRAAGEILKAAPGGKGEVFAVKTDVSRMEEVERLKEKAYAAFGEVAVLMNNAGTGQGGGPFDHYDRWQHVIGVNLWGVINGVHAFTPSMIAQGTPAAIVNTGSKQGITCPPGDTAYNVSKAGIKVVTEALQHALRNTEGGKVSAHLLVPGWTFTGLTARAGAEKPAGAWWPDQVIDMLIEGMGKGDFYIICPDNDVTRAIDNARILWAAGDIAENRPPLSRWHKDYGEAFKEFLAGR